jgi:succinate dehydrogenase hydrophobic anchor subunit
MREILLDLPEAMFTAFVVGMFVTMIFVFCGVLS